MSYIDLEYFKRFRPQSVPENDDAEQRARDCIDAASEWFSYYGNVCELAERSVQVSGNGTKVLLTPHRPIVSVKSLSLDGTALRVLGQDDANTSQQVFIHHTGKYLVGRFGRFPQGSGNILLTYTAGIQTLVTNDDGSTSLLTPADYARVVAMVAGLLYEETTKLGISVKTLGPEKIDVQARNMKDYEFIQATLRRAQGVI